MEDLSVSAVDPDLAPEIRASSWALSMASCFVSNTEDSFLFPSLWTAHLPS